jgi:hypothetical protein
VSFSFRGGTEAKQGRRFGFIAQELQQVLPNVVRGSGAEYRSVLYQDLIALLTLAAKQQQGELERLDTKLKFQTQQTERYTQEIDLLKEQHSKEIDQHSKEIHVLKEYIRKIDNVLNSKMTEGFSQVMRKMIALEAALETKTNNTASPLSEYGQ